MGLEKKSISTGMEELLDTLAMPYDPARRVLFRDEQPAQLLNWTRHARPGDEASRPAAQWSSRFEAVSAVAFWE